MEILQVPNPTKIMEVDHEGHIKLREHVEELDWYWVTKIYNRTKKTRGQDNNVLAIQNQEGWRLSPVWQAFYV